MTIHLVLLIAVIVVNLIVTKNYYFSFIQKKIKAGYQPDGEENKNILQKAGITGIYSDGSEKERTTFVYSQKKNGGDALEKIEKLKKCIHLMHYPIKSLKKKSKKF